MERHRAATATAGKALRVAGKGAAEFGKGVVSGVKTVGKVARDVRRVVGESEEMELDEKIDVGANAGSTISDFVHSNSETFKGDSKEQRIKRALGAYYAAKQAKKVSESASDQAPLSPQELQVLRQGSQLDAKRAALRRQSLQKMKKPEPETQPTQPTQSTQT